MESIALESYNALLADAAAATTARSRPVEITFMMIGWMGVACLVLAEGMAAVLLPHVAKAFRT